MCYTSLVEKEMNEAMHFLLDAGAVAVLLLLAVIGAKKGFIKACADFCGSLLAMIGAGILSGPAAEWIYGAFFARRSRIRSPGPWPASARRASRRAA